MRQTGHESEVAYSGVTSLTVNRMRDCAVEESVKQLSGGRYEESQNYTAKGRERRQKGLDGVLSSLPLVEGDLDQLSEFDRHAIHGRRLVPPFSGG